MRARTDAKSRALVRLLRRVREPAIVFTEYRDTLTHLSEACRCGWRVAVIHGGMDRTARAEAVGAFNRGAANVLLATDAAAHGLNLQSGCRLVISLELPWNPVRLEQRIGRVDRIGQRRTVHAVHLVARHTSEEEVLARLAVRVERARTALGSVANPLGTPSEAEVAEAVFAGRHLALRPTGTGHRDAAATGVSLDGASARDLVASCRLTVAAREEVRRLTQVRALLARQRGTLEAVTADLVRSGPWFTRLRLRTAARTTDAGGRMAERGALLAIFETEIVDGRGLSLDRALTLVTWRAPPPPGARGDVVTRQLEPDAPLRVALEAEAARCGARRLAELQEALHPRLAPARLRQLAIADESERAPVVACQPGLFDRRALRQADDTRRLRQRRRAELEAQMKAIAQAARVSLAGPPRLLLVAVVER